jgi:hypothetical protein
MLPGLMAELDATRVACKWPARYEHHQGGGKLQLLKIHAEAVLRPRWGDL